MDAGFYSADYLRAWIRSAQLRAPPDRRGRRGLVAQPGDGRAAARAVPRGHEADERGDRRAASASTRSTRSRCCTRSAPEVQLPRAGEGRIPRDGRCYGHGVCAPSRRRCSCSLPCCTRAITSRLHPLRASGPRDRPSLLRPDRAGRVRERACAGRRGRRARCPASTTQASWSTHVSLDARGRADPDPAAHLRGDRGPDRDLRSPEPEPRRRAQPARRPRFGHGPAEHARLPERDRAAARHGRGPSCCSSATSTSCAASTARAGRRVTTRCVASPTC